MVNFRRYNTLRGKRSYQKRLLISRKEKKNFFGLLHEKLGDKKMDILHGTLAYINKKLDY